MLSLNVLMSVVIITTKSIMSRRTKQLADNLRRKTCLQSTQKIKGLSEIVNGKVRLFVCNNRKKDETRFNKLKNKPLLGISDAFTKKVLSMALYFLLYERYSEFILFSLPFHLFIL